MPKFIDITGHVFNHLTVVKRAGTRKRAILWLAQCKCGKEITTTACCLKSGNTKSCGCQKPRLDLAGQRFGRLLLLRETARDSAGRRRWAALCDCGKEVKVRGSHVTGGATSSCGCLGRARCTAANTTHGADAAETVPALRRTYQSWASMRGRCYQKSSNRYYRYGDRGIKVCARWRHSFENFLADMGQRPDGTSIDRKNNNGNYTPRNCRWATPAQQAGNRG